MSEYVCTLCGYVHDPNAEDVPLEELPSEYVCSICGAADKNLFEKRAECTVRPAQYA